MRWVKEKEKDRKEREEVAEMGWEEMSLLSRPDFVGFPYTRACMYNLILEGGMYIYNQTEHIAGSSSTGDMNTLFITVYCFHLLTHLGQMTR